jgi:hypothetical protein
MRESRLSEMAMKCQRCGFVNPDGSVFCDRCGERIVIGVGDLNDNPPEPYIVWRGLPFAFLETRTLTRFQFFVRLIFSLVIIFASLPIFWMIGLAGLWIVVTVAAILMWYFAWSVGRSAAVQRPDKRL